MMENNFDIFYESFGVCTDTRDIKNGCLFICIKGDNFDGNEFSEKALSLGAKHVIVDNQKYFIDNGKMTYVNNSVHYLQSLANQHRKKFDIPVIAITGSNGKTTTKELSATVLSTKFKVLATEGNLNNHLGVPLTLLKLDNEHDIAIIEMGANHPKEIKLLCDIAEPTHGIITNIGKAHLEGFINFEGVLNTKKELYDFISLNRGKLIVNSDDPILMGILPAGIDVFSYGTTAIADIIGEIENLNPFLEFTWRAEGHASPGLQCKMVGQYNLYNYLAAISLGVILNVEKELISKAVMDYEPINNRSQLKKTNRNTLILDCYNANPTSMQSAIENLAVMRDADLLFILGDMKELGDDSNSEHEGIILLLEEKGLRGYVVGKSFSLIQSTSIIQAFDSVSDLEAFLQTAKIEDKFILIKGSRSVGLEIAEKFL